MPLIICNVSALSGVHPYLESIRSSWLLCQMENQDTDLVLVSGSISVEVHQSVLLPLSSFLLDLVQSSSSSWSSCQCSKMALTIPQVSQKVLRALVDLLYVGRCTVESEQVKKQVEDLWSLLKIGVPISCVTPTGNEAAVDNSETATTKPPLNNNNDVPGPNEKGDNVKRLGDDDHITANVKRQRKPSKKKADAIESIDSTSKRNRPRSARNERNAEKGREDVTSNTEFLHDSRTRKALKLGSNTRKAVTLGPITRNITKQDSGRAKSSSLSNYSPLENDEPIIRGHGLPGAIIPEGGTVIPMTINDAPMSTPKSSPNSSFNNLDIPYPTPSHQKNVTTRSGRRIKRKTKNGVSEFWSMDKVTNLNFTASETASNEDANESEGALNSHKDFYTVIKPEDPIKEKNHKLIFEEDDGKESSQILEENGNLATSSTAMDKTKSESDQESCEGHPCLFCDKLFANSVDLQGHLSLSHFKYEISRKYPGLNCQLCKKSFVTKSGHVKHMGTEHKIIEGLLRIAGSIKLAKMKEIQRISNGGALLNEDAN